MEFSADDYRRAIVAGQPSHQFRLARARGRVHKPDCEAFRHSGECQPAGADHRVHGADSESKSYSFSYTHSYCYAYSHGYRNGNPNSNSYGNSYSYSYTHGNPNSNADAYTYSYGAAW